MNFGFTLNIDNRETTQYCTENRKPSLVELEDGGDDTFERVLTVTSHQEALMAYYYLNNSDKMELSEVYNINETHNNLSMYPPSTTSEVTITEI